MAPGVIAEGCSRGMLVKRPLDFGTQISEAVVLVARDGEKLVHLESLQSKYELGGLVAKKGCCHVTVFRPKENSGP